MENWQNYIAQNRQNTVLPRPDMSQFSAYQHGVSRPFSGPYVSHFHKNEKHLLYVGAQHQRGPVNDTFATIDAVIQQGHPQVVVIEGLETKDGMSPLFYQQHAVQKSSEHFASSEEPQYAAYQAMRQGIPFIGGEPSEKDILIGMMIEGYSPQDLQAFYLLRWVPRLVEYEGMTEDNMKEMLSQYLEGTKLARVIPEEYHITVDDFLSWYDQHNDQQGRSLLDIKTDNLAPIRSQFASFFETMSADTGEIREQHLDNTIADLLESHDRVMVVYGSGHLLQSQKVFEQMFGSVEHAKLR